MNITLTQLEYLVAVDTHRHFSTAASQCFISQPTLSMQIQKAEEEMGVVIFDRSKQPVVPTQPGEAIIRQARRILQEKEALKELIATQKDAIEGDLRVGIIPTLAPYLLPLFLPRFLGAYPKVQLKVTELTTDNLVESLKKGTLDAGVLVTPLHDTSMKEEVLFYEDFVVYVSKSNALSKKNYVLANDIDVKKLWLLEEGHCFRSQVLNLCALQKASRQEKSFQYEAGSIETLRKMVELDNGITILPELATLDLTARQKQLIHRFKSPAPTREVGLVTHRNYIKKRLIDLLKAEIQSILPTSMRSPKRKLIIEVTASTAPEL